MDAAARRTRVRGYRLLGGLGGRHRVGRRARRARCCSALAASRSRAPAAGGRCRPAAAGYPTAQRQPLLLPRRARAVRAAARAAPRPPAREARAEPPPAPREPSPYEVACA